MAKILIVDDDETLRSMLRQALCAEHVVETASCAREADDLLRSYAYDVIILDWQLPDGSGVAVLKEHRRRGGQTPIIMLTGKKETEDKEEGLDAGADDYLTKPFNLRELRARVAAVLRRSTIDKRGTACGDMFLDLDRLVLQKNGREIELLVREVQVLDLLMRGRGEFIDTATIIEEIWGDSPSSQGGLTSCIKRLRNKVDKEGEPSFIETAPRKGYRLRI